MIAYRDHDGDEPEDADWDDDETDSGDDADDEPTVPCPSCRRDILGRGARTASGTSLTKTELAGASRCGLLRRP